MYLGLSPAQNQRLIIYLFIKIYAIWLTVILGASQIKSQRIRKWYNIENKLFKSCPPKKEPIGMKEGASITLAKDLGEELGLQDPSKN